MTPATQTLETPRSALFVPADRPDRYARAMDSGADAVIVDLEDAVAPTAKDAARRSLLGSEVDVRRGEKPLLAIRVNSPLTAAGEADIAAIGDLRLDAVVIPKADPAGVELGARLSLPLIALTETAAGILSCAEIASHPAVSMLFLGALDLAAELGIEESDGGDELSVARGDVVMASSAAGLPAPLDSPCVATREAGPLQIQLARARRLGFGGKACIHPAQVAMVNEAFQPSEQQVEWARRVIEAGNAATDGATVLDGRMIDRPVVARARQILEKDERNSDR